jgi:toxin ParE1/3/4
MRVEYSKRAIADLRHIAAYHARSGNPAKAARIAARLQEVIARIAVSPLSGRAVVRRPGVRVALLPSYRYKIFYRVAGDAVRIVHIRHTSRRPYD